MSEADFQLFAKIMEIAIISLYAGCFLFLHLPFLENGKRMGRVHARVAKSVVLLGIYFGCYLFDEIVPLGNAGFVRNFLMLALLTLFSGYLEIHPIFEILLCVLFKSCQSLSVLLLQSPQYLLNARFVESCSKVEDIFRNAALISGITVVLECALCMGMLYPVRRFLRWKRKLHLSELLYLILIPTVGILFVQIALRLSLVPMDRQVFSMYEEYPAFRILIPVISFLIYAGLFASLYFWQVMQGLQIERAEHLIEQRQIQDMRERIEEVEQFYDEVRRLRHELRNHLTNLQGLFQSGNYRETENYLSKLGDDMERLTPSGQSGNLITDIIISDKRKQAKRLGIAFQSEFRYPDSERYNAYDVGIIVNNLLVNAIEACQNAATPEAYIVLTGHQWRKFFLIEVRNPYSGEIVLDERTGLPVSTKTELSEPHGIGLLNVRREAQKYHGDVRIRLENQEFCVSVLLQQLHEQE